VNPDHPKSRCYRVGLPSAAEALRILGQPSVQERTIRGITYEAAGEEPGPAAILCGDFGPPCFHCGGVSDALCDFPLGEAGRTCDRPLCLECAPNVGADGRTVPLDRQAPEADYKNYCHDHDERGRGMLLFPQPKRTLTPPGPPPRARSKPLPRKPPESHRWRVRQGRGDPGSHGAVLTEWMPELDARRFAGKVGGYVETWNEFVKLWRELYPLKTARRSARRGTRRG